MRCQYLLLLALISATAPGAEKEFTLRDGRVLTGELVGEKEGKLVLAMKMDEATASIRLDRAEVVSVKDVPAAMAKPAEEDAAPKMVLSAPAGEGDFARVRGLLAQARQEAVKDELPLRRADDGYPYPVWQHWPWTFTIYRPLFLRGFKHHGGLPK